jgi:hypothetical protein
MKDKLIIITVSAILIVIGVVGGYFVGIDNGKKLGYVDGYDKGRYDSYEKGYSLGYDNGKEFVVTHLDDYIAVPKAVSYDEVVEFLKEDKTDKKIYIYDVFDCVKENANKVGIRCAIVVLDLHNNKNVMGHSVNAFDTLDKGIVYFSSQTDNDVGSIQVGGSYNMSGIQYKITKVDVIW